jgi:hypothetical protein
MKYDLTKYGLPAIIDAIYPPNISINPNGDKVVSLPGLIDRSISNHYIVPEEVTLDMVRSCWINSWRKEIVKVEEKIVEVKSSDGKKTYIVKKDSEGKLSCTCTGFGFRGKCKHLENLI